MKLLPFNVPGEFVKAIRAEECKYVWYASGEEELYDLILDPAETHNVASVVSYVADKAALKLNLLEWHALAEDPLDESDARRFAELYPW